MRLNRLCWFGHVQRMEGNRSAKRILYMNLGATRLRGRPRNRWQDDVREDGRTVGEGWQEKVHNSEEWKKLLRTARNRRILHVPMEWMNGIPLLAPHVCLHGMDRDNVTIPSSFLLISRLTGGYLQFCYAVISYNWATCMGLCPILQLPFHWAHSVYRQRKNNPCTGLDRP